MSKSTTGSQWYWAFFVSKVAMGASSALVPLFVIRVLGGGVTEVTITAIAATASTVPAYLVWGAYVDRTGRCRRALLWGKAGEAVAYGAMAVAPGLWAFVGANFIAGIFIAATVPTSTILVLEATPRKGRAKEVGHFTKVNGVGWVAGMVLGAAYFAFAPRFIDDIALTMRLLMGVCTALFAVSFVMSYMWVPQPTFRFDHRWFQREVLHMHATYFERPRYLPSYFYSSPGKIRRALRVGSSWGGGLNVYLLSSFLVFVGFLTFYTPFPVLLSDGLAMADSQIFIVYLASAVMAAALYGWAGAMVDRIGNQSAQLGAWVLRIFFFLAFGVVLLAFDLGHQTIAFVLAASLNGALGAMYAIIAVAGTTTVARLAPEAVHGEAVGAYNAVVGVGVVVGGVVGGVVASLFGWWAVILVTAGFIGLAAFLLASIDIK